MEQTNKEFTVPFYIVDELIFYIEETAKGHCKISRWNNIKALLNCAKVNNKLTEQQVKYIIDNYCRE